MALTCPLGKTDHDEAAVRAARGAAIGALVGSGPRELTNLDLRQVMPSRCARGCPRNKERSAVIRFLTALGFTYGGPGRWRA